MARTAIVLLLLICATAALRAEQVRVKLAGQAKPVLMDMEEYVAAALAGEAGGFKSMEALKAMAVVSRTYACVNRGRHKPQGYDYCETTHCQDLRARSVTPRLREAANATEGIVLWAGKRPALVFYTEHCGGHTENAATLWRGAGRPWLKGVEDSFCLSASRLSWRAKLPLISIARALDLPQLTSLDVARRTDTERVALLHTNAGAFSGEALHLAVGRELGWKYLHSKLYDLRVDGSNAYFEGWGRGHGVGLCQTGADERGKAGHTWRQILAAYFPGTRPGVASVEIDWRAMHTERVDVFGSGGPGEQAVPQVAQKALVEAERLTGRRIGVRPVVRAYPTVAVFREATHEPGFVAASTRGRVIRLQPAGRLATEGRLERTLLHEMLHIALSPKPGVAAPRWFEEGLALWLEQPSTKSAALDPRTEQRLLRPATEAELRTAYENAKGAVAGLVQKHGRDKVIGWTETGLPPGIVK